MLPSLQTVTALVALADGGKIAAAPALSPDGVLSGVKFALHDSAFLLAPRGGRCL